VVFVITFHAHNTRITRAKGVVVSIAFFVIEFLICIAYSLVLERWKHLWEPDFTGVEVMIGCIICMATAAAQARWATITTWQQYEAAVWWSFIIGAIPIAVWQAWRYVRNRRRLLARITRSGLHERRNTTQAYSQTLATASRGGENRNPRSREVRD
jgi:hypothetical protein